MDKGKDSQRPRPRVEIGKEIATPPAPTSEQRLDNLYVDETLHEEKIDGVTFMIKELDGKTLTSLLDQCSSIGDPRNPASMKLDRSKYVSKLIMLCVVEPKKLEVARLKPGIFAELGNRIEAILGLGEVARKNSEPMSNEESNTG